MKLIMFLLQPVMSGCMMCPPLLLWMSNRTLSAEHRLSCACLLSCRCQTQLIINLLRQERWSGARPAPLSTDCQLPDNSSCHYTPLLRSLTPVSGWAWLRQLLSCHAAVILRVGLRDTRPVSVRQSQLESGTRPGRQERADFLRTASVTSIMYGRPGEHCLELSAPAEVTIRRWGVVPSKYKLVVDSGRFLPNCTFPVQVKLKGKNKLEK